MTEDMWAQARCELSYIAGFLDADGSVYIMLSRSHEYPIIAFHQSPIEPLPWISQQLLGGRIHSRGKHHRLVFSSRDAVLATAKALLPYTKTRAASLALCIEFYEGSRPGVADDLRALNKAPRDYVELGPFPGPVE